jgi:hypothetical protein
MEINGRSSLASAILAVKTNNGKLAGKLGSVWINNNNIFHINMFFDENKNLSKNFDGRGQSGDSSM